MDWCTGHREGTEKMLQTTMQSINCHNDKFSQSTYKSTIDGQTNSEKDIEDICFFSVKDRNSFHQVDTIGNIFTSVADFSVKDRNSFHRVDTISNIFTSGCATRENITDDVHAMK